MSRRSPEFEHLVHLVPLLVELIETRGRAELATKVPGSDAGEMGRLGGDVSVYAMLAIELNQSPEAVRQELLKYRRKDRCPSASKVVRLVEAATRLGWISKKLLEPEVNRLVRWCYAADKRIEAAKRKRSLSAELRIRGELQDDVRRVVEEVFRRIGPESADEAARDLVTSMASFVGQYMANHTELLTPASAHWLRGAGAEARDLLDRAAKAVTRERAQLSLDQCEELHGLFFDFDSGALRSLSNGTWSELRQHALALGIGEDQLLRIVRPYDGAKVLSADDSRRRAELIASLSKLRLPLRRDLDSASKLQPGGSLRSWPIARKALQGRRLKSSK